uniref:Uncharacterized protein n=1 Tax=Nelumbo nucifera TaxID=4432 RepID=A0A822XKF2_NELNU|nr:TPA_asm: hypothetical protein HUJ06_022303 [Nelumbo nucifera]
MALPPPQQPHVVLSGGKENLGALTMLEDSVKKLKRPNASLSLTLSKNQIDSTFDLLADWHYESCGVVSFSGLEHPKFRAFLNQVGLPSVSRREFVGSRLDARFEEAKAEPEARIKDSMFFQVASNGWKPKVFDSYGGENVVNLIVNLPMGRVCSKGRCSLAYVGVWCRGDPLGTGRILIRGSSSRT